MRSFPYKLEEETYEEQRISGRYNPATILVYRGKRCSLACGDSDDVEAFIDGKGKEARIYVVSLNTRLDYVGLQVFDPTDIDDNKHCAEIGSVFCQGQEHYEECLGKRGLDLHPRTIAKYLEQYCGDCC